MFIIIYRIITKQKNEIRKKTIQRYSKNTTDKIEY